MYSGAIRQAGVESGIVPVEPPADAPGHVGYRSFECVGTDEARGHRLKLPFAFDEDLARAIDENLRDFIVFEELPDRFEEQVEEGLLGVGIHGVCWDHGNIRASAGTDVALKTGWPLTRGPIRTQPKELTIEPT